MYYNTEQTYYSDDVPVSVTMEEDPNHSGEGDGTNNNGNYSDASDLHGAARLLQVTLAAEDTQDANGQHPPTRPTTNVPIVPAPVGQFPGDPDAAEDEYILQKPSATTNDRRLENQIARDLDSLSETDRQHVYFDMRGEAFKADTPSSSRLDQFPPNISYESLDSSVSKSELELLDRELFRLLQDPGEQEKNPLYHTIANTLTISGPDFYANSVGFRTKLLRAECKDIQKAARRTASYLALLLESFGEALLSRPIRLSDLSTNERQLQRRGFHQLFRFRDQFKYQRKDQGQTEQDMDVSRHRQDHLRDTDTDAGRRIAGSFDLCRCINTNEPALDDKNPKTRVLLYMLQVASEDEETQTHGIVFIFMMALRAVVNGLPAPSSICTPAIGGQPSKLPLRQSSTATPPRIESDNIFANDSNSESDTKNSDEYLLEQLQFSPHERTNRHSHTINRVRVLSNVFRNGPVRVAAIHVCAPSRVELQDLKLDFLQSLDKQERVRTRCHNGTSMECSLSLNKVGVPTDRLPLKYDGTIKTDDHLQWIAIQEAKELATKKKRPFEIVECPMNMDILSGRGQLVRSHPGNISFRKDFIRARSVRYDMAANREEKNSIADEILKDISILKRRFLKQHQGAGYWTELDKKTSKEKVMMAFREFRKSQRNQRQQQQVRRVQSQPAMHQPQPHPQSLLQPTPSLHISQSLPHSPVSHSPASATTAMQHHRRIGQPMPPTLALSALPTSSERLQLGHREEGLPLEPLHEQQAGNIHYQLYPPILSSAPSSHPGEAAYHHQIAPPPQLAGIPPPYLPYPPHLAAYGHPIPPHLLPPPHHLYPPPHLMGESAAPSLMGTDQRPDAAGYTSSSQIPLVAAPQHTIPLMSYQHHVPAGAYSQAQQPRPSSRQRDGGANDRSENDHLDPSDHQGRYKRYRSL